MLGYVAAGPIARAGVTESWSSSSPTQSIHLGTVMLLGCETVSFFPEKSNDPTVRLLKSNGFVVVLEDRTHSNQSLGSIGLGTYLGDC